MWSKYPTNNLGRRKHILWGNKFIKLKGESLKCINWLTTDITYINDIIYKQGNIYKKTNYFTNIEKKPGLIGLQNFPC